MSLRLKFLILITGAIVVPIVVFFISFKFDTDIETLKNYHTLLAEHHAWRKDFRGATIDAENPEAFLAEIPMAAEVRVFDEDGELLLWRALEPFVTSSDRFHFTETVSVNLTSGGAGVIVVTRPASPLNRDEDRWYVPLAGLLFIAIMVILIAQSINRSIGNLEKATGRIADGDLDFELPIRGNDKLAALTRSFDSMREHLKEEYARRSRFIMGISHDLKTPLASISGYANAIGEGYADTPEKLEKFASIIEDKTKLLESRISMLIDYVKRETSEWKMNLQPVEVRPFLGELAKVFESEAALMSRTFAGTIQIPEGTTVPMDEDMVVRAMENLMQNALRYSSRDSEVRFVCTRSDNTISISFINDGPGIDPVDLPHIYDPFVRGGRDRKGAGLGLGLATVESIISSHGWNIAATSDQEEGTVFTLTIPL